MLLGTWPYGRVAYVAAIASRPTTMLGVPLCSDGDAARVHGVAPGGAAAVGAEPVEQPVGVEVARVHELAACGGAGSCLCAEGQCSAYVRICVRGGDV